VPLLKRGNAKALLRIFL